MVIAFLASCGSGQGIKFTYKQPSNTDNIPLLSEGGTSFYAWKTYPDKYRLDSTELEFITTYKTLTYEIVDSMTPFQIDALEVENTVRYNYLFFIDDHRVIYFSQDEDYNKKNSRENKSSGILHLYFEGGCYDDFPYLKGPNPHYLCGKYSIKGDKIYLEFISKKHIYIKANYNRDSIVFQEINFDPSNLRLTDSPIHFERFDTLFFNEALPKFELIDLSYHTTEEMKIPLQKFKLFFGFKNKKKDCEQHPLHKQLLFETYNLGIKEKNIERFEIMKISLNGNEREYSVKLHTRLEESFPLVKIKESLIDIKTW